MHIYIYIYIHTQASAFGVVLGPAGPSRIAGIITSIITITSSNSSAIVIAIVIVTVGVRRRPGPVRPLDDLKIHQRGVQWKQGVVVYIRL